MQHLVYILYSKTKDQFYIGFTTEEIEIRLDRHNNSYYENKFTKHGIPWEVFKTISCKTNSQALAIEHYIKKMKSKVYIRNLEKYPEIISKLLERF